MTKNETSHCHNLPVGLWPWEVLIWSSSTGFLHPDVVIGYFGKRTEEKCFISLKMRDKKKKKRRRKNDQTTLPPTEFYLSDGPLSRDKLIVEIRGHFLCLFTCSRHTVISQTHSVWPSSGLEERSLKSWCAGTNCLCVNVCVCVVFLRALTSMTFDSLNLEPNKLFLLSSPWEKKTKIYPYGRRSKLIQSVLKSLHKQPCFNSSMICSIHKWCLAVVFNDK